MAQLSD